jgi:Dna[CI] antecedent, DciA
MSSRRYPKRATARAASAARRDPEPVGALLETSRETTRLRGDPNRIDSDAWRRAVGARVAERAVPERLRAGTLTVSVASAVWAQELSLLSDEIVARLRRAGAPVTELRFRVRRLERTQRAPEAAPKVQPVALPRELAERLEQVDDPELRAAIASAAGHSLALQDQRRSSSAKPAARGPRSAASRNDRPDRTSDARPAEPRRNRAKRRG